jgi:restriction system protein
MITCSVPEDWKALQNEVGKILEQCGFSVEVEKKVDTARGEAKLDVYAEEVVKGRKYSIVCECKHWKSSIPQSIIHSFRSILNDTGANVGYIIALKGFQCGAFKAANYTNLDLVTWEEFQKAFCDSWLEQYLSPVITEELDPILGYTEPLVQKWMCEVPDHEVPIIKSLREKYFAFGVLIMAFTTYSSFLRAKGFPKLPLSENWPQLSEPGHDIPKEILEATGYREFLHESLKFGKQGIREFKEVRDRNNV